MIRNQSHYLKKTSRSETPCHVVYLQLKCLFHDVISKWMETLSLMFVENEFTWRYSNLFNSPLSASDMFMAPSQISRTRSTRSFCPRWPAPPRPRPSRTTWRWQRSWLSPTSAPTRGRQKSSSTDTWSTKQQRGFSTLVRSAAFCGRLIYGAIMRFLLLPLVQIMSDNVTLKRWASL